MELAIEQPCPTCGAPIVLQEDDRLVTCGYCEVRNYKVQQKLPRYVLPSRLPQHVHEEDLLYIPYLRFKGSVYYCQGTEVRHKIVDTTRRGTSCETLPVSLGLRPQAMNVKPVSHQFQGSYVKQTEKAEKMFAEAARLTTLFAKKNQNTIAHRAFIGETVSRVYLPVYAYQGLLYDGVTHRKIGDSSMVHRLLSNVLTFKREWEPLFLSTLCPGCGDAMQGGRDSLVMRCSNCESQWIEVGGRFVQLTFGVVRPLEREVSYIPFWQIEPEVDGADLSSLADFLHLTNQPVVVQRKHFNHKLSFIIPAFKVNPVTLLQAAKNLTMQQLAFCEQSSSALSECFPVTLPHSEAVQALKSVLAASAVSSRRVMELLPKLNFHVRKMRLLYLPFRDAGHDYIQHHTGVSLAAAALRFGRSL